jgi:hypothetical protein
MNKTSHKIYQQPFFSKKFQLFFFFMYINPMKKGSPTTSLKITKQKEIPRNTVFHKWYFVGLKITCMKKRRVKISCRNRLLIYLWQKFLYSSAKPLLLLFVFHYQLLLHFEIEKVITAPLNSRELQSCYFLFFILSVTTNLLITLMDQINAMAMVYINIIIAIIVT